MLTVYMLNFNKGSECPNLGRTCCRLSKGGKFMWCLYLNYVDNIICNNFIINRLQNKNVRLLDLTIAYIFKIKVLRDAKEEPVLSKRFHEEPLISSDGKKEKVLCWTKTGSFYGISVWEAPLFLRVYT